MVGGVSFHPAFYAVVQTGVSASDPNTDPDHAGSGRRHWSGEVWKATAPVTNSTKCARKRPLNFQSNIRDQEAPGSNPGTPTTNLLISGEIRRFSLLFVRICLAEFFIFLPRPKQDPYQTILRKYRRWFRYFLFLFLDFLHRLGHEAAHSLGRFLLHLPGDMGVGIQREARAVVSQDAGDCFGVYSLLDRQCGESVT